MSSGKAESATHIQKPTQDTTQKESIDTSPTVPSHVIFKLLGFTLAMVVGPIGCYFATLNNIFGGNSTYAGATAAITANMVLFGYIVVAFQEDHRELSKGSSERKIK